MGNRRAVTGDYVHIGEVNAKIVGADLSERRLLSLPLRRRARKNINLAVGPDFDAAAFIGTEPCSLDVGCDADTKSNTVTPRFQL